MTTLSVSSPTMRQFTILDPAGVAADEVIRDVSAIDDLEGMRLGILLGPLWWSWYVFADRLEEVLRAQSPDLRVERWFQRGALQLSYGREGGASRPSGENERVRHAYAAAATSESSRSPRELNQQRKDFAGKIDAVVVGLGN